MHTEEHHIMHQNFEVNLENREIQVIEHHLLR